jgi:hypothetical protein
MSVLDKYKTARDEYKLLDSVDQKPELKKIIDYADFLIDHVPVIFDCLSDMYAEVSRTKNVATVKSKAQEAITKINESPIKSETNVARLNDIFTKIDNETTSNTTGYLTSRTSGSTYRKARYQEICKATLSIIKTIDSNTSYTCPLSSNLLTMINDLKGEIDLALPTATTKLETHVTSVKGAKQQQLIQKRDAIISEAGAMKKIIQGVEYNAQQLTIGILNNMVNELRGVDPQSHAEVNSLIRAANIVGMEPAHVILLVITKTKSDILNIYSQYPIGPEDFRNLIRKKYEAEMSKASFLWQMTPTILRSLINTVSSGRYRYYP